MNEATIAISILSFLLFAVFLGFFIWALRTGQFKNAEEASYHVFWDPVNKREKNESDSHCQPGKEPK